MKSVPNFPSGARAAPERRPSRMRQKVDAAHSRANWMRGPQGCVAAMEGPDWPVWSSIPPRLARGGQAARLGVAYVANSSAPLSHSALVRCFGGSGPGRASDPGCWS